MSFNISFPGNNSDFAALKLQPGEMMFVLGANGSGKSCLMQRFASQNRGKSRKIAAHRQTWMNTNALDMTPASKIEAEKTIQSEDGNSRSRYKDRYAEQRARITIYELVDAENVRARAIAAAYDAGHMEELKKVAKAEAPITVINDLLKKSNLPITISIQKNERVMAQKLHGPEYSAAELSDGERNALLIAANILTAPEGTLIIIDEPERHLHRSIITPLLNQLFERRPDCGFVISTHDHYLPMGNRHGQILLLRSCNFQGNSVQNWEADELAPDSPIDDILKRDLLGARRKILFVEGTEGGLDKPLYSIIFPMVSVIAKSSCHEVERSVVGIQAGKKFHWLQAFGIVDGDGLDDDDIEAKREKGVYALPYYSVEAIYFHPQIIYKIAERQALVLGEDSEYLAKNAITAGIAAISGHTDRLSNKAAKKIIRKKIIEQIPNDNDLMLGEDITVTNNSIAIHASRKAELDAAIEAGDWLKLLAICPVRESAALADISKTLRFQNKKDYEKAVRSLLTDKGETLAFVQLLFEDLTSKILD